MIFFPKLGDCDLDPPVFQHPECTDVMDFFERRIDNITSTSLYCNEMASTLHVLSSGCEDAPRTYQIIDKGLWVSSPGTCHHTSARSAAQMRRLLWHFELRFPGHRKRLQTNSNFSQGILCKAFWEHLQNRRSCDSGSNRCGTELVMGHG